MEIRDRHRVTKTELTTPLNAEPPPISYREAVRYLAHRLYLRTARYKSQLCTADTARLDPAAEEFQRAFVRHMAGIGIPAYCDVGYLTRADEVGLYVRGESDTLSPALSHASGHVVSLAHGLRGREMDKLCWEVFSHVGHEVAGRLGLGVQWGGMSAPWQWSIDP